MASLRAELTGNPDAGEPVALENSDIARAAALAAIPAKAGHGRAGIAAMIFTIIFAVFWIGAALAFLWGYFGPRGLEAMGPPLWLFAAFATLLPPLLFLACTLALRRARVMGEAALTLALAAERLTTMDEAAPATAQRLGRAVRRELDALSAGLDSTFGRMRALETALEERIAQLEEAGARAGVRAETIAERLQGERQGIETLGETLDAASARAAEMLAGRVAQLNAMIEAAGGELRAAGTVLDTQSRQFRESVERAASAPQEASVELDRQAQHIEAAANNAVSRAEFVLARQERQRNAMSELLGKMREESTAFETAFEAQRNAIERASAQLNAETQRLDEICDQGVRRVDSAMMNAASRAGQISAGFGREAERIQETADMANAALARVVESLREAALNAQALMTDSSENAKQRAKDFVGEAMGQCDLLLRASANVAEEAEKARAALQRAAEDAERHIIALPGVATQEAERMREALRGETAHILDISARTPATLQARASGRKSAPEEQPTPDEAGPSEQAAPDGLRGFARRLAGARKKPEERSGRSFELSAVLAAAESRDTAKAILKPSAAAALAALQVALSDLASDLDGCLRESDNPDLWRRYLDGDRAIFARALAGSIGPSTVDRITELYRDNPRFHEAADAYLTDFEALLARARESDRDGFLASTFLSADTGKIYLAVAYALGRLE